MIFPCSGFESPCSGFTFADCLRNNSDDSDARAGSTGGSFYYHGNLEPSAHDCSPVQTSSASFNEWSAICQGTSYRERVEIPSCSTASSFSEIDGNHVVDHGDNLSFDLVDDKTRALFMNTKEEFGYKSMLPTSYFNLNVVISCAFWNFCLLLWPSFFLLKC